MIKFLIYLFAFSMLACACITYCLLAVGARFDRAYEDFDQRSIDEDGQRQGLNNHVEGN